MGNINPQTIVIDIPDLYEIRVAAWVKTLEDTSRVKFTHNESYYEVFESAANGFVVNVFADDKKDHEGDYLEKHIIDGGLCTGSARDAIEFML